MPRGWCQTLSNGAQRQDREQQGHDTNHKKFHLNMRSSFTLRVAKHWSWLPREVMDSFSLETSKTHPDAFLCHLLQVTLPWQRGLTR